ncbi:hypothetical protein BD410DRAFT_828601 [Rickenella mellea]|uniref:Uncharacterized protein n=1 Tax=Rickenella mellea TaxID=50990 RepID=A0A4Y7Q4M5_9AGAM|nr:hypothetical protein BD410DRAFT_828601 [Rickenella mellea]
MSQASRSSAYGMLSIFSKAVIMVSVTVAVQSSRHTPPSEFNEASLISMGSYLVSTYVRNQSNATLNSIDELVCHWCERCGLVWVVPARGFQSNIAAFRVPSRNLKPFPPPEAKLVTYDK